MQDMKQRLDDAMREQLIIQRCGHSKAKAEHFTPQVIKNLKPDGTVLHWQYVTHFFQGYYKIPADKLEAIRNTTKRRRVTGKSEAKTHWSFFRKYGQVRTQVRAQVYALSLVVNWLWDKHAEMGHEQVLAALGSVNVDCYIYIVRSVIVGSCSFRVLCLQCVCFVSPSPRESPLGWSNLGRPLLSSLLLQLPKDTANRPSAKDIADALDKATEVIGSTAASVYDADPPPPSYRTDIEDIGLEAADDGDDDADLLHCGGGGDDELADADGTLEPPPADEEPATEGSGRGRGRRGGRGRGRAGEKSSGSVHPKVAAALKEAKETIAKTAESSASSSSVAAKQAPKAAAKKAAAKKAAAKAATKTHKSAKAKSTASDKFYPDVDVS